MIDLHNDALLALPATKLLPYLRQAKRDGVTEIWLSVWTTKLKNPLATIKAKQRLLQRIANHPDYPLCRLHIEDAWFLTPENLTTLIKLRPHSVGLTWNAANALAGGAHSRAGITPFGYQVIRALEAAGIQIDTAHLNRQSFNQLAKITTRPLLCTHTAWQAMRRHPRNLTDRQIKKIIASGGQIGLCLVPQFLCKNTKYCGIHDIIKHIQYFKKHFNVQHLCFGTDFYGTDTLPHGITGYRDLPLLWSAEIIGYSLLKQPLIAYHIGHSTATKRILVTGGMHAREWITSHVVRAFMHQIDSTPTDVSYAFIPECNPDGVQLATQGLTPAFHRYQRLLTRVNRGQQDFHLWKANARAVDLNVNFDAGWGLGAQNCTHPAPANYIGKKPHSEPETKALVRFVQRFHPTISLAFHSKGEVIYYSRPTDAAMAQQLATWTQYQAVPSLNSYGGLTDYLALKCGIPSFTIEVGADQLAHPITTAELPQIMSHVGQILHFFTGA